VTSAVTELKAGVNAFASEDNVSEPPTDTQEPNDDNQLQGGPAGRPAPSGTKRDFDPPDAADAAGTQLGDDGAREPGNHCAETPKATAPERENREPEEDNDDADSEPTSGSGVTVKVAKSEIKEMYNAETMYQTVFKLSGEEEKGRNEKAKSLLELTTEFRSEGTQLSPVLSGEVEKWFGVLKAEHFLLINCLDGEIAFAAARALMERLDGVEDERKRQLINLEVSTEEQFRLRIGSFWEMEVDSQQPTALFIDAISKEGKPFAESLLTTSPSAPGQVKLLLEQRKIFMLCIADPGHVEKTVGSQKALKLSHWDIPFLQTVLKEYDPDRHAELEARILRQRERGAWRKDDDAAFCEEVKGFVRDRSLPEEVEKRESLSQPESTEKVFEGWSEPRATVLYAAAFFPGLQPPEFREVVERLLGERTLTVIEKVTRQGEGGATEVFESRRERALVEVWRETQQELFKACRLSAAGKGGALAVSFVHPGMKEKVREEFERDHSLYLDDQFQRLEKTDLLFHRSARVAAGALKLTAKMMAAYPDYYGEEHLAGMIETFERSATDFATSRDADIPGELFYKRVSELLREVLGDTESKDSVERVLLVERVLRRLMSRRLFGTVLKIIEKLQFAPAFKELKWVKQLLEQGNAEARAQTEDYLYSYLKMFTGRIYEVLSELDAWLPVEGRAPYPARTVMCLLVAYLFSTVAKFSPNYYGSWPTPYLPLAFKNTEAATANLRLLVRWLFHPEMESALLERGVEGSTRYQLIVAWSFILLGKGTGRAGEAADGGAASMASAAQPAPAEMQRLLLLEIMAVTGRAQQNDMLAYWEALSRSILADINKLSHPRAMRLESVLNIIHRDANTTSPPSPSLRGELVWKRNRLGELISQFKSLRSAATAKR
jgi:hypothetical protein